MVYGLISLLKTMYNYFNFFFSGPQLYDYIYSVGLPTFSHCPESIHVRAAANISKQ